MGKTMLVAAIVGVTTLSVGIGSLAGSLFVAMFGYQVSVGTQDEQVLVGAGDIASCTNQNDEATAELLDGVAGTVFTTGDNVYDFGTAAEFNNCYEPNWGRHKARTQPVPGNHDYADGKSEAEGYFDYFGSAAGEEGKGYYSYELGDWHLIALNSACEKGMEECEYRSSLRATMVEWLKEDLATNSRKCTLAYWHHPLFSSGAHGNNANMKPIWEALYEANVDVVVNGHDHVYERFAPQDPNGVADLAKGIREFVVGTGGREALRHFNEIMPSSEVRNADTYGVLKLTLHPTSYDWEFVPVPDGTFADSGSDNCH